MIIFYEVSMNGYYMNSFKSYTEACKLRDDLNRKYPNKKIEILTCTK